MGAALVEHGAGMDGVPACSKQCHGPCHSSKWHSSKENYKIHPENAREWGFTCGTAKCSSRHWGLIAQPHKSRECIPLHPEPKIHLGWASHHGTRDFIIIWTSPLASWAEFYESPQMLCVLGDNQTPKTKRKGHVNIVASSVSNRLCLHINVQYKFVNMSIWNFWRNRSRPFPFLHLYWNNMSPAPATHGHGFHTGCISNGLGAYLFCSILLSNPRLLCIIVIQIII